MLMLLRTLWLFILLALFLNPLLRRFRETVLPPVSVILVDDSRSVQLATRPDSLSILRKAVSDLKKEWIQNGQRVVVANLQSDFNPDSSWTFNRGTSPLEPALRRIREEFENQNLNRVFLLSDGILNQGRDLSSERLPFPVHTVRLGNPASVKDISIPEIRINKVAFLGNSFPVSVLVKGRKIPPGPLKITASEGGKIRETRNFSLSSAGLANVDFNFRPESKGIKALRFEVEAVGGEVTTENNQRTAFIEVLESRQKVLLLASVPHPDIGAIRSALQTAGHIDLTTRIGSLDAAVPDQNWDLIILHQLPDRSGTFGTQVKNILSGSSRSSLWLFATPLTDFSRLRTLAAQWLGTEPVRGGGDEIQTRFSPSFQRFQLEEKDKQILEDLPPVRSPSASFVWKVPYETILDQKLGKIIAPAPLLSVQSDGNARRAVFWADGLWLWRLNAWAKEESMRPVDDLIQKTVQLLLAPEKKGRLILGLNSPELAAGEAARFRVETFNSIFEPVFDQKITIELTSRDRKTPGKTYSFVNAQGISEFSSGALEPGVYRARASALLNGRPESDEIEFVVRPQELEAQELEADHRMLQEVARKNGGFSSGIGNFFREASRLEKPRSQLEFTDWNESVMGEIPILILMLILAGTEWLIRKINGLL